MKFFKKNTKEFADRNETQKGTERWSNRAFFTHVKAGVGTKKWWTLCMVGRAGNLDIMSSSRWAQTGLSLECFRANQIRKARQRFAEGGGENIEYLVVQRILELQGEDVRQEEEQHDGQDDEEYSDPCES